MPATDDPGAAVEHVTCPRRRRVGTFLGVAITVVALGLAVAFGLERDDDPGRVAIAVVALHDQGPTSAPAESPPDAGVSPGFSHYASRAGWRRTGARRDA